MKFLAGLVLAVVCGAQAQFEILDGKTTASLRGIDAVNPQVAWASGSGGTVLLTTDGGANWKHCAVPSGGEKLDFRGVQGFAATTAIVMSSGKGDLSRLYKTGDGCETWKLVFTNPDSEGFWDAVQFYRGNTFGTVPGRRDGTMIRSASTTNGILVGDPVNGSFAIFSTRDGGETWHRWGDDPGTRVTKARPDESIFAASNSSVVSPGINGQYCFVTGGKAGSRLLFEQGHSPFDMSSWSAFSSVTIPFVSGDSAGAFSIGRRDEPGGYSGRFVIVGGDYSKPAIGAAAFAYQPSFLVRVAIKPSQTPPHGYRSAVAYDVAAKTWITVGPNGSDISKDDGKNWTPLKSAANDTPDADKNWNAISLPFVVGSKGKIGKLKVGVFAR